MDSSSTRYVLGPFVIESQIALPELERAEENQIANVFVRVGSTPKYLVNAIAGESRWTASRDELLLCVDSVGSFLVSHGNSVVVEPSPNALEMDIRAYILAPIFSTLCQQNGMFALHGSSIEVDGGVVAFLGRSGSGKSTLAAYLRTRGYQVMSDDICLVDARSGPSPQVLSVAPTLKLCRNAVEHLGGVPEQLPRVFSRNDKHCIKLDVTSRRLPLRQLLFLQWAEESKPVIDFTPLNPIDAISRMIEDTHLEHLIKAMDARKDIFLLYAKILEDARAAVFRRPLGFDKFPLVARALEDYLATN